MTGMLLMLGFVVIFNGCQANINIAPEAVLYYTNSISGIATWGKGGYAIWGSMAKTNISEAFEWRDGSLSRVSSTLFTNKYLCAAWVSKKDQWFLGLLDTPTTYGIFNTKGEKCRGWQCETNLYIKEVSVSDSGKWISIIQREHSIIGSAWQDAPVGIYNVETEELKWLSMTLWGDNACGIGEGFISNDGRYLAIKGTDPWCVVVDVINTNVLWRLTGDPNGRQKDEKNRYFEFASINDASFSLDGETVYLGDGMGYVYGIETRTGKVLSRWTATQTGESIYGQRITQVAISPDEKYVAAGTGPTGETYIWERKTGRLVNIVQHGRTILILQFSPDSQKLATMVGNQIKVWSVLPPKDK